LKFSRKKTKQSLASLSKKILDLIDRTPKKRKKSMFKQ